MIYHIFFIKLFIIFSNYLPFNTEESLILIISKLEQKFKYLFVPYLFYERLFPSGPQLNIKYFNRNGF